MAKERTVYLVMQQGGTSREFYASTYDTAAQARRAIRRHERASYNAYGPFPVGVTEQGKRSYVSEPELLDVVQRVIAEVR